MRRDSDQATVSSQLRIRGNSTGLEELESTLSEGSRLEECVILPRVDRDGKEALVAYLVPVLPYVPDRLEAYLRSKLPMEDISCVPVSRVPLTESGLVDQEALRQLPVIDKELVRDWNEQIQKLPGISEAVVVVRETTPSEAPPLHLTNVIPEWKPTLTVHHLAQAEPAPEVSVAERTSLPPAFADGGPLFIPKDAPKTLTEAFLRTARECSHKGIFHIRSNGEQFFQSYPALLQEALCILTGLYARGLKAGARVILQLESVADHFSSFWACVLGGMTPVTVAIAPSYAEQNSVVNKLHNVWKLLDSPVILASQRLVQPLVHLERFFPGEKFEVISADGLKGNPPAQNIHASKPEDVVFLQLTSGSTGTPKCVQESHRSIIAHIHGSQQFNRYSPDNICLNWLPVDHVVPMLTFHLKDVYLGCQEIQVETGVVLSNPLRWLDLIEAHRVTHTWSPNFGFKLLSDRLASAQGRKWDLSSVEFFMNAGEQVTLPVVREFLERVAPFGLREHAMQPAFGMAEVCTAMTYLNEFAMETGVHHMSKSSLGARLQPGPAEDPSTTPFVDLGPPIPGVQIRITDAANRVLPEGVIGRLQIKGEVLTCGYLHNEEANGEAFVGDGWFNSGDLGFILRGRLTLTGREKEMIIVRGVNFYCFEIEDVINSIPGVEPTFTGCCAVSDPATGTEGLAIFFVPQKMEERVRLTQRIRSEVGSKVGIAPSLVIPLSKQEFPKTTSGKIQRSQLKKSLSAGVYDPICRELDATLGNANTLPDWFYRRVWRRKEIRAAYISSIDTPSLIFVDGLGLGQCLFDRLGANPANVRVYIGTKFAKLNRQTYQMDPAKPEHYRLLFESIAQDGIPVHQIFHLWTYREWDPEWEKLDRLNSSLNEGALSLVFLLQALSEDRPSEQPCSLFVVSSNSQHTGQGDRTDSTRALILGLVRTVGQEVPWLACRHVDLPGSKIEEEAHILLQEAQSRQKDLEVAWRNGLRWVPRLAKIDFRKQGGGAIPLQRGGTYLVTGGLGGVGLHIARLLLSKYQARLLVIGRTALPECRLWNEQLGKAGAVPECIRGYQELERLGEVMYAAADICDLDALRRAVERAEERWGRQLAGVFHLAGLYQERLLNEETTESFLGLLRPKVLGSLTLNEVVKSRPGALLVSFASLNGVFGGLSVGAYSAANAFLDSFAQYQRDTLDMPSQCLVWSMWDETGMSRGLAMKDLARARGYHHIAPAQALNSFLAALCCEPSAILIGVDSSKPFMRRFVEDDSCPLSELAAYFVLQNDRESCHEVEALSLPDRFGTPSKCKSQPLEQMPHTAAGVIDQWQLSVPADPGKEHHEPPGTAVEQALARIWSEALGIPQIGRNDNFFNLGGHSLSAVQIAFRIRQAFNVDFPLQSFVQAPVLCDQAECLVERLLEQSDTSVLEQLINEVEHLPENNG